MQKNKVAIIDCEHKTTPLIHKMLRDIHCRPQGISWHSANETELNSFRAVIISGGNHLFSGGSKQKEQLIQRFEFLETLTVPTLGICLGHQAIGLALGGKVYRGVARRNTDVMTIVNDYPLFINMSEDRPEFSVDHCEGIELSSKMTLLASSQHYQVEAVMGVKRPLIGVQFHPETSGENGQILFKNFIKWADKQ
ncbi:MAG: gamma-glutamyl-gamma-aminobutyrate hydrolase family protein [Endozoicomonas sp. (ex Botrylloides leachii)]|nr:gamma-glutamyl-gamma-aminobutyrate hydrolase family protein [Endozoicomonas sp. (ex Botrylloides leachii)]